MPTPFAQISRRSSSGGARSSFRSGRSAASTWPTSWRPGAAASAFTSTRSASRMPRSATSAGVWVRGRAIRCGGAAACRSAAVPRRGAPRWGLHLRACHRTVPCSAAPPPLSAAAAPRRAPQAGSTTPSAAAAGTSSSPAPRRSPTRRPSPLPSRALTAASLARGGGRSRSRGRTTTPRPTWRAPRCLRAARTCCTAWCTPTASATC